MSIFYLHTSPAAASPPSPPGADGSSLACPDSNGEGALRSELALPWPSEAEGLAGSPAFLAQEDEPGAEARDGPRVGPKPAEEEDICTTEDKADKEDEEEAEEEEESNGRLEEEETQNCEEPSPPSLDGELEGSGASSAILETITIPPLDCSQAELRTRIIKEVRKPGRSE